MSRTSPRRTTGALLAGAVLGALALAGCGAGQIAQTAYQVDNGGGAFASSGPIRVLDAKIELTGQVRGDAAYAAGQNAPISLRVANVGEATDTLVGARSPVATAVQIEGTNQIPPGVPLVAEGTAESAAATAASTGDQSRPPTHIVLTGLTQDIKPGLNYPLVLVFQRAGEVQLDVPVEVPTQPRS